LESELLAKGNYGMPGDIPAELICGEAAGPLFRNKSVDDLNGQARILSASVTMALAFNDACWKIRAALSSKQRTATPPSKSSNRILASIC